MHGSIAGITEPFIPTKFGSGVVLWLSSTYDRSKVTLSGSDVTGWNDNTLYANDGTTFSLIKPTYTTSGINGLPSIVFNGQFNTEINIPHAASLAPTSAISVSAVVRFTVGWYDSFNQIEAIICKTNNEFVDLDDGWGLVNPTYNSSAGNMGFYVNRWQTENAQTTGLALNTNYILTGIFNGTTNNFYVNGTLAQSISYTASIGYQSTPPVRIGSGDPVTGSGFNGITGQLSDIVVANFALTTDQRQQLERGYFKRIYGITA